MAASQERTVDSASAFVSGLEAADPGLTPVVGATETNNNLCRCAKPRSTTQRWRPTPEPCCTTRRAIIGRLDRKTPRLSAFCFRRNLPVASRRRVCLNQPSEALCASARARYPRESVAGAVSGSGSSAQKFVRASAAGAGVSSGHQWPTPSRCAVLAPDWRAAHSCCTNVPLALSKSSTAMRASPGRCAALGSSRPASAIADCRADRNSLRTARPISDPCLPRPAPTCARSYRGPTSPRVAAPGRLPTTPAPRLPPGPPAARPVPADAGRSRARTRRVHRRPSCE